METTHPTHHPTSHTSAKTDAKKSMEATHSTHHSTPHPSGDTDTQKSPEASHSTFHPSTATDGKTTSKSTSHTGPLTCNCTSGAGCQEHHCTTEQSKHFCVTTAEDIILDPAHGIRSLGESRTCGDNVELCNKTISITLNEHTYWRSNTTCCHNRDNCNSHSIKAPPADTTQSKLVCPSCFAVNSSACVLSSVRCAGLETKCINVSGTVEKGNTHSTFAGQGCATSTADSIENGTTLVFGDAAYHFTRITMTDAKDGASQTTRSVPFTFLLSSFVGLLQAKFIY
ncbi:PREDICTED: phospholipase A2 inhibitor and Ly6/PLAUR domain-containing protein-like [Gekko japonicus]|uniref:Phospholipase A2 inhibitor and Ly6/PLAUR domain-containing protein-like n=1 Tax=Gekko japonicus TaxID=146911 RepID=A0ABM1KP45_GEKJA|nr:PREDICTED: phospholipase A2 inhibitor and Ly6/PLAUR domain-containing protein-like [Gekko japonicus]